MGSASQEYVYSGKAIGYNIFFSSKKRMNYCILTHFKVFNSSFDII